MKATRESNGLWVETSGGNDGDVLLLVHGMGANGALWDPLLALASREWKGRIVVPDLAGHGRSAHRQSYSFGTFAADLAGVLSPTDKVHIIGHSLGAALAGLLGTGWFGVDVRSILALSMKTRWSQQEVDKSREVAQNPVRWLPAREEATLRYLKMAGLGVLGDRVVRSGEAGVVEEGGQFRLAADQKIFGSAALGADLIMKAVRCPIAYATGALDTIASAADMEAFGFHAAVIDNAGHNVQVEAPDKVWDLFTDLSRQAG